MKFNLGLPDYAASHIDTQYHGFYLLTASQNTTLVTMKPTNDDRQRYRITESHRNQTFVGVLRRDPDTYCWTWKGHIDFDDGYNVSFASQRSFNTNVEAEDYMRRFAHDRIDNRLNLSKADRF